MTKPKTIKTTDDLPEWFNIAEYEFTEKLDNAGWVIPPYLG
jgi:hypothetical protein